MKRWIAFAAELYPRSWREQFGEEFGALLDDVRPGWRVFANVLGGAVKMQITTGTNWLKLVAATAVLGAVVAWGISFTVAPHYVSTAVISVTPQPDPVRPNSPQTLQQRAAARAAEMERVILSRTGLSTIIQDPRLDLYKNERRQMPLEDVIEQMRRNIRVQVRPSTDTSLAPIVFDISFSYPDRVKARATVRELATKFAGTNAEIDREQGTEYRSFWQDMSALKPAKPVPPPPPGEIVSVLDPASPPKESGVPNRPLFLAWGLGAGLLLGLLAAVAMRWPRGTWKLAAFAATGFVLAAAASFLIPNRYTSMAVMMIAPARITEDALAALPPVTPASEFLRQIEPQILSFQSLSMMIQDPRLDLYPSERSRKPMEEIARTMLARDIHIAIVNPALRANGASSAFSISFSYSDTHKAQQVVQTLTTNFMVEYLTRKRENASQMNDTQRGILERKAGENLEIVDSPSLAEKPDGPNRLLIASIGLGIGLLLGAITLGLRRPRTPALQPA